MVLYVFTRYLLESEIEEELYSTEVRVAAAIKKNNTIYTLPPITDVSIVDDLAPEVLKDTVIYDPSEDEMELFRELSTYKAINGINYHITIRSMAVDSEEFLLAIVGSNMVIFILAFVFLFFFNTKRNLNLWRPFFKNLEQMKRFSLTSKQPMLLMDSEVLEFSELKTEIETLTNKVKADYESLKQFTEDVSHEMQTPLAIIQAKIDNIINEHLINDKQYEQITSIQKDIQRLKQLNKRITILTKIDKNQFVNVDAVNLTALISEKIENFKELGFKNIVQVSPKALVVLMDAALADILVNNLVSNAIRHSATEDKITLTTTNNMWVISNAGDKALVHPEKLFQRFYRETNSTHSTGLGLAIVKKICDLYEFDIAYAFEMDQHVFSIKFKNV